LGEWLTGKPAHGRGVSENRCSAETLTLPSSTACTGRPSCSSPPPRSST
jgi:hypothetical protein